MALTAEQKNANKEKRLARDRAYRLRYNEWQAALKAALAPLPLRQEDLGKNVEPAEVVQAAWAADARFDAALAAAEQEERSIRDQITKLQESLKGVRERHNMNDLADVRRNAYSALSAARKSAEEAVDAEYSDVARVFSAAAWGAKVGFAAEAE